MKRSILSFLVLIMSMGLAGAAEAVPTEEGATATVVVGDIEAPACVDPYDGEVLVAAGFTMTEAARGGGGGVQDCPAVHGCGGVNTTCRSTGCSASDTGLRRCRLPNRNIIKCTRGQTIHVNNCGCQQLFQAACCTADPACLCVGCNNSSSFLSCQ